MKRNILIAIILLTPFQLPAKEQEKVEVNTAYDPENLCMHENKLYSLGATIKIGGKEHKCIYNTYTKDLTKPGAMWGTYNQATRSFLP